MPHSILVQINHNQISESRFQHLEFFFYISETSFCFQVTASSKLRLLGSWHYCFSNWHYCFSSPPLASQEQVFLSQKPSFCPASWFGFYLLVQIDLNETVLLATFVWLTPAPSGNHPKRKRIHKQPCVALFQGRLASSHATTPPHLAFPTRCCTFSKWGVIKLGNVLTVGAHPTLSREYDLVSWFGHGWKLLHSCVTSSKG